MLLYAMNGMATPKAFSISGRLRISYGIMCIIRKNFEIKSTLFDCNKSDKN